MRRFMADQAVPVGRLRRKPPGSEPTDIPYSRNEKAGQTLTGWRFNLLGILFLLAGSMIIIQLV